LSYQSLETISNVVHIRTQFKKSSAMRPSCT
jgi:hypothetical protein